MKSFLCISAIAVFLVAPSTAINCSRNKCSSPGMHTLCRYPNRQPAACRKVMSTGFTQAEKAEIVNTHNTLRKYVAAGKETRGKPGPQPAATNMNTLRWDDEIAEIAQRWANQCQFGHDECKSVDRFSVSQNVYSLTMSSGTLTTKPSDIIRKWYDEVKYMDRNNVYKNKFSTKNGHYTQIVWANTKRISCGKIIYQESKWYKYCLVCNYGPTGNFPNQPIYPTK